MRHPPSPTHAGEIHPVRDFSDTLLNVFSYKQDRFHAVLNRLMPCLIHVTYPQFQFIVISVIELFCCNYRYLDIFVSDILFFKRNERREKSALKFTLIESLFMRLQREMLSNFLSLSDFFLIQYKTRKRPLNTIENFDTPPPPHPCRRNSVFGRVRDQVVTGPIEKI